MKSHALPESMQSGHRTLVTTQNKPLDAMGMNVAGQDISTPPAIMALANDDNYSLLIS